jgi:putative component of toxin-antitoxin plasmid stabilization module
VERRAIIIDKSEHGSVEIYVDLKTANEILPFVFQDAVYKEFKDIRALLKGNLRNRQHYCKLNISVKAKNVFEMRFTRGRNDRIYCKEFRTGSKRRIVMIELYQGKKSQHIPKQIKSRIEKMGGYEYHF